MFSGLRTKARDCVDLAFATAVIVLLILLFLTFLKIWHGAEQILTFLGRLVPVFAAFISGFSGYFQRRAAGPEQVVPTVVLRNAIATTSAAGNAATYFVREVGSLQRHSLVAVDGMNLFASLAVPTAQVAVVEQGIEKLQKKLSENVPREVALFYNIRAALEHVIRDLASQHNVGSSYGSTSGMTEGRTTISQKEKGHRKTVKQHLKNLEKLLPEMLKRRDKIREYAKDIKQDTRLAGAAFGDLQFAVEEANTIAQKYWIDEGGSKNGDTDITTTKEPEQELIERIDDLGVQVWLQHAEMKARTPRAENLLAASGFELEDLKFLQVYVAHLSERVSRNEVGVEDAAMDLLQVVNGLIGNVEEKYLQTGHNM